MCHTHQAFKHLLRTFSGKLRTLPTVKSKTIGFPLDRTQQCTPVLVAKTPRELLPEKELLSGHYATHSEVLARATLQHARDSTMCALEVVESASQNDFYCYRRTSHITL